MLNIILNPASNGGKVMKTFRKVYDQLVAERREFRVFETEREKQAIYLANDLTKEGPCDILAVGGDGTLNEVVNGFSNFENCRRHGQRLCRVRQNTAGSVARARSCVARRGKVYRLYAD